MGYNAEVDKFLAKKKHPLTNEINRIRQIILGWIRINDENEYQKYIGKSSQVFKKSKGRYMAVDIWYL